MFMTCFNKKNLALTTIFAMLYASVTIIFSENSYDFVQFRARVSDCLTVLAVFSPVIIFGTTIGCVFANLYGFLTIEAQKTMPYDFLIGSFATLLATTIIYYIGKSKYKSFKFVFAPLSTIVIKALIIGGEIAYYSKESFAYNALNLGISEVIICYLLGVPVMYFLFENNSYKKIFNAKESVANKLI
jgi:uncharacterized membrane protein